MSVVIGAEWATSRHVLTEVACCMPDYLHCGSYTDFSFLLQTSHLPFFFLRHQLLLWWEMTPAGVRYPESRFPYWAATWHVAWHLQVHLLQRCCDSLSNMLLLVFHTAVTMNEPFYMSEHLLTCLFSSPLCRLSCSSGRLWWEGLPYRAWRREKAEWHHHRGSAGDPGGQGRTSQYSDREDQL